MEHFCRLCYVKYETKVKKTPHTPPKKKNQKNISIYKNYKAILGMVVTSIFLILRFF